MNMGQYVFADTQQEQELQRLRAIETQFDPATQRRLENLDLKAGWTCLEVGAGAGSIAQWMCEAVGLEGQVVAVDINPRFVEQVKQPNLEVRCLDIAQTEMEPNRFDLVHARCVLLHIHDSQQAIANMMHTLKPGGWLVLEEPDFSTGMLTNGEAADRQAVTHINRAILKMYESIGIDPYTGQKLPALLQSLNLQQIAIETDLPLAPGGSGIAKIMQMSIEHLAERLLDTGIPTQDDIDRYIRLADLPTAWATYYTTVAVWGQKPN
jgi:ubiquinone/menaquinone biosynthesis C-methylase UbiE